jgi:hypothetical protein
MPTRSLVAAIAAALVTAAGPSAALLSKTFEFKTGTVLEVAAEIEEGLRLDTVRFDLPAEGRGSGRAGGLPTAEVTVSNLSTVDQKVGIAIALFDAERRLVGVASGGTAVMPLRAGRQKSYTLAFQNVNGEAASASTFQISLEVMR